MIVPATVSGRPISNRGIHLVPSGFHNTWMEKADYWINLLQDMGMSWVVVLSEDDSVFISGAAKALLDAGIIPIVRFKYQFGRPWTTATATAQLAELYAKYNAPLIIQIGNEPLDDREWKDERVPPEQEMWYNVRWTWYSAARQVIERGGIAGFPDGPSYTTNPFLMIGDDENWFRDGRAVYLSHNYGKGRPLDYPLDDVSHNGTPLTMAEYREALDDYADDHDWNEGEGVLNLMNIQREEWANPDLTPNHDDVGFLGWMKTLQWSREAFGFDVQIALTEGGWTPRDRAGSNPVDIRWPYTTPKMVAKKTLAMYEMDTPLFAICPWLLADDAMCPGGYVGWPFDAWVGWAYADKYGREKPVVQMLSAETPIDRFDALLAKLDNIITLLET